MNAIVCEKYNIDNPVLNQQISVNPTSTLNNYGMYKFYCGTAYSLGANCGGACVD